MRKCLLFVALLVFQFANVRAQDLFEAPDTVCVRQPIQLVSNAFAPLTNYWGFCSGYLLNNPVSANLGAFGQFQGPSDINIERDNGQYYGFVTNSLTSELIRLNYGASLENTPTETNLGTLDGKMPPNPNALYIVKDDVNGQWHVFIVGGTNPANSSLTRVDFGTSLAKDNPNIANMYNVNGVLNAPTGLFIQKQNGFWRGWCVNEGDNSIAYLDFFENISYTPICQNLGNINNVFNQPSDVAGILDNGNWYLFVTNQLDNTIARIDLGANLNNTAPTAINIGNPDNTLFGPSAITLTRDCDNLLAFITNAGSSELVRVTMPAPAGPYGALAFGAPLIPGQLNAPTGISKFMRNFGQDNIYTFITNTDLTITRVKFLECTNSSISSSESYIPPVYAYDTPGLFNVYYVVDEGLPTMQVGCKQIRVVRIPDMELSNDTTICRGDTISLRAFSAAADTVRWRPATGISDSTLFVVTAYPPYTIDYNIHFNYPNGCEVDTNILVTVRKLQADAGPDRELKDGASTILGGPMTVAVDSFNYRWFPYQYISDTSVAYPEANPPHDFTYYLEVSAPFVLNDTFHICRSLDTVVVRVTCGELNMPNAFMPASNNPLSSRFGLLNKQITKLSYFRIYDRWGQLVFYTNDPTKQWDGTIDGQPALMGVYVWDADGFCTGGKRVKKSGNVTLIR
jgi:hypothetical protein